MCFPYNCSNGPFILGPSSVCVLLGSYAACDISCGPDPCWDLLGLLSSYDRKVGVGWRVDHPGLTLTSNRLTGYWWCTFQKKKSSQMCQKLKQQIQTSYYNHRGRDRSPRESISASSLSPPTAWSFLIFSPQFPISPLAFVKSKWRIAAGLGA